MNDYASYRSKQNESKKQLFYCFSLGILVLYPKAVSVNGKCYSVQNKSCAEHYN